MEKLVKNSFTMERKGVFDKHLKKRFELTFECKNIKDKKKSILVIGLNPASHDIAILDTTTTFLLNNLIPMGYTTITICNLYAELFKERLKPSEIPNNTENLNYLSEIVKHGFDTILLGYGNTFTSNKFVNEQKKQLIRLLESYKDKVVDLVDEEGKYSYLRTTHPLMAGRYFPNQWKLRPFDFCENIRKKSSLSEKEIKENEEEKHETKHKNTNSEPVVSVKTAQ